MLPVSGNCGEWRDLSFFLSLAKKRIIFVLFPDLLRPLLLL